MADGRGADSHGHAGIAARQPRHGFDCKKDFRTREHRVFSISYAESGRTRPIAQKGTFELPCRWRKSLSDIQKALRHDLRKSQNERMVGARGFEPPTPCAQGRCATRLRHAPSLIRLTYRSRALNAPIRFAPLAFNTSDSPPPHCSECVRRIPNHAARAASARFPMSQILRVSRFEIALAVCEAAKLRDYSRFPPLASLQPSQFKKRKHRRAP